MPAILSATAGARVSPRVVRHGPTGIVESFLQNTGDGGNRSKELPPVLSEDNRPSLRDTLKNLEERRRSIFDQDQQRRDDFFSDVKKFTDATESKTKARFQRFSDQLDHHFNKMISRSKEIHATLVVEYDMAESHRDQTFAEHEAYMKTAFEDTVSEMEGSCNSLEAAQSQHIAWCYDAVHSFVAIMDSLQSAGRGSDRQSTLPVDEESAAMNGVSHQPRIPSDSDDGVDSGSVTVHDRMNSEQHGWHDQSSIGFSAGKELAHQSERPHVVALDPRRVASSSSTTEPQAKPTNLMSSPLASTSLHEHKLPQAEQHTSVSIL